MFCKYCGKQISDESVYCQHCGKQLKNETNVDSIINKKNLYIAYGLWASANFYLLLGNKRDSTFYELYPFSTGPCRSTESEYSTFYESNSYTREYGPFDKDSYDFSEFVLYVFIIPYFIYKWYNRKKSKKK